MLQQFNRGMCLLALLVLGACGQNQVKTAVGNNLQLKRGSLVSCGNEAAMFGNTRFMVTVPDNLRTQFNTAVSLLHSFEYDEAEKMFAKVIDGAPDCAMAYWGVAMANFHPLWSPPDASELEKGAGAVKLARGYKGSTLRETAYINAVGQFYDSSATLSHRSRVRKFELAMHQLHAKYPDDIDGTVFYALSLDAAADQKDKSYINQKKAFALLAPLFNKYPLHPGVTHLIIHSCDYPALASLGLDAARKYASIAPASAHAQHMPSHIFTRLGYWDECVRSNKAAVESAICYAAQAGIKGHWDEELHALDYLMYSYLQQGDNKLAGETLAYVNKMETVTPANFKTAHAFAAIPARYVLENRQWAMAAKLPLLAVAGDWNKFPWQQCIVRLARVVGLANTKQVAAATSELDTIQSLYERMKAVKANETELVRIYIHTGTAWILFASGNLAGALAEMQAAADLEDSMDKHPVTPGEVIPAREFYADLLLQSGHAAEALHAYEEVLLTHANRFNAMYGAAIAASKSGNKSKAAAYSKQLHSIAAAGSGRRELKDTAAF